MFSTIKELLERQESSTIDFKRNLYDFTNDQHSFETAKFVKDIVSFANTIRTETAYIIMGVESQPDQSRKLIGIQNNIDEAILQDKTKDKVFPRPVFNYITTEHEGVRLGVIEIPVIKYVLPLSAIVKLKGMEVGKIYYRRGSSNTEALATETIKINDWLRSLPDMVDSDTRTVHISSLIKRTTEETESLSSIFADATVISKKYGIDLLSKFCVAELKGIIGEIDENKPGLFSYRMQKVLISVKQMDLIQSFGNISSARIKASLSQDPDFFDFTLLFSHPINTIENYLRSFSKSTRVATVTMKSSKILPNKKASPNIDDYDVHCYLFQDTFESLYRSIRQKFIDLLVEL